MKILVAGGGTGGHIIPNLALLTELQQVVPDLEVLYVGEKGGMEEKMAKEAGWTFAGIWCGKLRRYFSFQNFLDIFKLKIGTWQSLAIILKFGPDVVFCKGGYVSLPVAMAAGFLRKPLIIHESDVVPGLANKIAANFAKVIAVSYQKTAEIWKDERIVVTGNPVNSALAKGNKEIGWKATGLNKAGLPVMMIVGGSQGSNNVNDLIWNNLDELLKHFQILHSCGKGKSRPKIHKKGYFQFEFGGMEWKDYLAIVDIFVSRAGANSLAEFVLFGKPAILIPLIKGSRGDQIDNGEIFVEENLGVILREDNELEFNGKKLVKSALELMDKANKSGAKKHHSNKEETSVDKLISIILNLAKK